MPANKPERHIPWYSRLWYLRLPLELFVGALVATVIYITHHGFEVPTGQDISEGLIHALVTFLALEIIHTAHRLEQAETTMYASLATVEDKLHQLEGRIENDERIILARRDLLKDRPPISVVTVEKLDASGVPADLPHPANGKWTLTISLLRYDRLQDLLFSPPYLKHFLQLQEATTKQVRILIVNKTRSEDAVSSFLQMSETQKILTFVYSKDQFYKMLECVDRHQTRTTASEVRKIMEGQPDLSLMFDDSENVSPKSIDAADEYLLRHSSRDAKGNETILKFGKHSAGGKDLNYLNLVYKLMHAAICDRERQGLVNFQAVLKGTARTNPWECEALRFLQR